MQELSSKIVGHEAQRERLKHLLYSGKLPTAIMLAGLAGIGKSLIAAELFRSLFCQGRIHGETVVPPGTHQDLPYGGCSGCHNCHLFDAGNLPDYYRIECLEKETWNIERIRDLLYSLNLRAFAGGDRAVLFNDAEHLSTQAANTLLKILEEPRPGTYFCLTCANPSRLPRTLLSRCQVWFFDRLTETQIKTILERQAEADAAEHKTHAHLTELAQLADGSLEGLAAISSDLESWRQIQERLEKIHRGDIQTAQDYAYELSRDKETLREKLKLMRIYARQRMREAVQPAKQAKWAVCLANLIEAERFIFERNINAQYLLSTLFLNLIGDERLGSFTTLTNSDTLLQKQII